MALEHSNVNDVNTVELEFDGTLFNSGMQAQKLRFIEVDFKDTPNVEVIGEFFESADNDGTMANVVTLSPNVDYFDTTIDPNDVISVAGLPDGLQANFLTLNG